MARGTSVPPLWTRKGPPRALTLLLGTLPRDALKCLLWRDRGCLEAAPPLEWWRVHLTRIWSKHRATALPELRHRLPLRYLNATHLHLLQSRMGDEGRKRRWTGVHALDRAWWELTSLRRRLIDPSGSHHAPQRISPCCRALVQYGRVLRSNCKRPSGRCIPTSHGHPGSETRGGPLGLSLFLRRNCRHF